MPEPFPLRRRATVAVVALASVLPVACVPALGWSASEAMFAYWVEISLVIGLYSLLVLVAPRTPRPDDRVFSAPSLSDDSGADRGDGRRLASWLPPIYGRNVGYAVGAFLFGFAAWAVSGTILLDMLRSEPLLRGARRQDRLFGDVVTVLLEAASVRALALGLGLFALQAVFAAQFLRRERESYSPLMMADVPSRLGLYWFLVAVGTAVLLVVAVPVVEGAGVPLSTDLLVLGVVLLAKLAVEYALVQSRHGTGPDGVLRWVTPENPRTTDASSWE